MKAFLYHRAGSAAEALEALAPRPDGKFLAGGTNLLDLMKDEIVNASDLVDLTRAGMAEIRGIENGISIGALATNTDTANHPLVRKGYPLLSYAILAAASVQIRNMATNGGNLLQRTRCPYFYDTAAPCNKRSPGTGCGALEGLNRNHAIFGASEHCVAVHPSDMAVALAALDANVRVKGPGNRERTIDLVDFHRLPGDRPEQDTNLDKDELIVAIELPAPRFNRHFHYLKVRDRASYAFALVSVAAALDIKDGMIRDARIAMGGVAHKPWRATAAESHLIGLKPDPAHFAAAADAEMARAVPLAHNGYKIELGRRAIVRALKQAADR